MNNSYKIILFDFFGTLVSYKPNDYLKHKRKITYDFLIDNGFLLSYEEDYLGATSSGMDALLIDPNNKYAIPANEKIKNILDLKHIL